MSLQQTDIKTTFDSLGQVLDRHVSLAVLKTLIQELKDKVQHKYYGLNTKDIEDVFPPSLLNDEVKK